MTSYVTVLTFPQQADAYQALSALKSSAVASEVTAAALVERDAEGRLTMPESADATSGAGFATGSLIGLTVGILGGPLGMLLGWGLGAAVGGLTDADKADDQTSALLSLGSSIPAGGNALVLQTDEDDLSALDHFAADHQATISRRPLDEVLSELEAAEEAQDEARQAAEDKLRAERKAERKENHEERIAKLKAKFQH